MAVQRDGGVAMRLGRRQRAGHALGRRQIEQVLRHIGTGLDRAPEVWLGPFMQAKQAEHRPECVEGVGSAADEVGRHFGRRESRTGLPGHEQAFRAQDGRDRVSGIQRDGAIGADDRGIRASALQRGLGQECPGGRIVRPARQHLRADPLGGRDVAVGKCASRCGHGQDVGAPRSGCGQASLRSH